MIDASMKRIAGMHVCEDGAIAVVWLAHDTTGDFIRLYDSCLFKREIALVIAEGINARGRWIPVAWTHKEMAENLRERGCYMLFEESDDSDAMAEIVSRDIWSRMRSKRFKVDKRLQDWADEYKTFDRENNKIPRDTHPLMAATRHAMSMLKFAKRLQAKKAPAKPKPRIAIV